MNLQEVIESLYNKGIILNKKFDKLHIIRKNQIGYTCYGYLYYRVELKEKIGEYTHLHLTPYKIDKKEIPEVIDDMKNKVFPNYDTGTCNFHLIDARENQMERKFDENTKEEITEIKQIVLVSTCKVKSHYGVNSNMKEMCFDKNGNEVKIKVKNSDGEIDEYPIFVNCYFPRIDSNDSMDKAIDQLKEFIDAYKG